MSPELMDFTYVFSHWSNSKLFGLFVFLFLMHCVSFPELLRSTEFSGSFLPSEWHACRPDVYKTDSNWKTVL